MSIYSANTDADRGAEHIMHREGWGGRKEENDEPLDLKIGRFAPTRA